MLKEGLTGVIAFTANAKIFGILRLQWSQNDTKWHIVEKKTFDG